MQYKSVIKATDNCALKFEEDDVMDSVLKSRYNFDIKNIQIEYESGKKLKLSENKFIEEKMVKI